MYHFNLKLKSFYCYYIYNILLNLIMSNRINFIMQKIIHNSKLNREKFVENKKKYNIQKNNNSIIHRKYHTFAPFNDDPNGDNNPNNPNNNRMLIMLAASIWWVVISSKRR